MNRKVQAPEELDGYNIHITGRHLHVTESMKDYATEKVAKIEKISDKIIDVQVTMDIQKLVHSVDIVIKVNHIKIRAHASSEDMYMSIDKAITKIQAQLIKYKEKIQKHQAKGLAVVDMNVNVYKRPTDELEELNTEIEEETKREVEEKYKPHAVVSTETRPLKILTIDEAIMKMELSEDQFLIFRREEDNKIKVIYRRDDGDFGIIEPE